MQPSAKSKHQLLNSGISKKNISIWDISGFHSFLCNSLQKRFPNVKFNSYGLLDGTYDICPVCFWEDDPVQLEDPSCEGGANRVSLEQARLNYKKFGACEKKMLQYVRKPNFDEMQQ